MVLLNLILRSSRLCLCGIRSCVATVAWILLRKSVFIPICVLLGVTSCDKIVKHKRKQNDCSTNVCSMFQIVCPNRNHYMSSWRSKHYAVVTSSGPQVICELQMERFYHVWRGMVGGGKQRDPNILSWLSRSPSSCSLPVRKAAWYSSIST